MINLSAVADRSNHPCFLFTECQRITPRSARASRNAAGLEFECPEEFGYYPHPRDCTQYYVCVFGGALLESCTGGLMYRSVASRLREKIVQLMEFPRSPAPLFNDNKQSEIGARGSANKRRAWIESDACAAAGFPRIVATRIMRFVRSLHRVSLFSPRSGPRRRIVRCETRAPRFQKT